MTDLANQLDRSAAAAAAAAMSAPQSRRRPANDFGQYPAPHESDTLGRLGSLEIRRATSPADVRSAQELRYKVFFEEMSAVPDPTAVLTRRDVDGFDAICDHLLVFDRNAGAKPCTNVAVGTYRLLRQDVAERNGGFYSSAEYPVVELIERHRALNFLELGRSCVLRSHRSQRTIELLWQGIYDYVVQHRIDVLVGCASFDGTEPDVLALPLSYLHHYALAPEPWQIRAHDERYVEMNRLPKSAIDAAAAFRQLPPLIRGYLRVGAYVGRGAVIDWKFATTDVLMVLPMSAASPRYLRHFARAVSRQPE